MAGELWSVCCLSYGRGLLALLLLLLYNKPKWSPDDLIIPFIFRGADFVKYVFCLQLIRPSSGLFL